MRREDTTQASSTKMADTKLRWVWKNLRQRCLKPNRPDYARYGGRGITVCERWSHFKNFKEDMKYGYKEGLTLDRIKNNEGYSKENCRWVDRKQQANNRRTNRVIEYKGINKNLCEWISYFNLKPSTVRQRYFVYKWDIERCFEGRMI